MMSEREGATHRCQKKQTNKNLLKENLKKKLNE